MNPVPILGLITALIGIAFEAKARRWTGACWASAAALLWLYILHL